MSGCLIQPIPGVVFSDSLPILYRDAVINAGTILCIDALDTYCWPSQAAGAGTANNLVPDGLGATVDATVGFNGGWVFDTDSDKITLPTTCKLAADADGFVFIVWLKQTANNAALNGIAGLARDTVTNNQYSIHGTTGGQIVMTFNGGPTHSFSAVNDTIYQLAIAGKKNGSTYDYQFFKNGVVVSAGNQAASSIKQPTAPAPLLGNLTSGGGFADDWQGVIYRSDFDDLSAKTAEEVVALDWSENQTGRFI